MAQQLARRIGICALAGLMFAGCRSDQSAVQRHAEKMDSLQATITAVVDAWLAGDVSGTYTVTTLERTFTLVAQEHAAVAASPQDLASPGADTVARKAEELLHLVAALSDAVRGQDEARARRQLHDLPGRARHP